MAFTPKNYVDMIGPVVSAAWLNQLDYLANNVFGSTTTNPAARTALTVDAPLEIANGGTAARTAVAALTSLGAFPSASFTAGNVGTLLYPQTSGESGAGITPTAYQYPPGQFERYGAVGDNTTDDSAAVLNAFKCGSLVTGVAGKTYYCGTGTLNITNACEANLYGVALRTAINGVTFLNFTGSDVHIRGAEIYGRGNSSYTGNEHLIGWSGTGNGSAPPVYVSGLKLTDCYLHDVGSRAIYSQFGLKALITNCRIQNVGYAGAHVLSGVDWEFLGGIIDGISPGTAGNSYGISFTRDPTLSDNLANIPRSKNCRVVGMVLRNGPLWSALDTHGGEEIVFANNIMENFKIGVAIGNCPGVSTNPLFAPKNCKSIGNTGTNPTPVSGGFGVGINGAILVTGTPLDQAEGCASIGDKMTGFGVTASGTAGGFQFSATNGLVVSGCQANQCFPNGIVLYHDNYGFQVTGCTIIDPYDSTVTNSSAVMLNAGYNTGTVTGNSMLRQNTGLGTTVAKYAINLLVNTASVISVGPNYSSAITYTNGITGFGGWGTPTGGAVVANYPGATATLVQTSNAVAQILTMLLNNGTIGV